MKKCILFFCVILLAGCTKYPPAANLNLQVGSQTQGVYYGATASIRGHDARSEPEVVVYSMKDQAVVKVPNMNPPHILVTERLAGGLREQGLMFETASPVRILVDINELLVTVTKPKLLYKAEAKSKVTLRVVNTSTTLTKHYNREASREAVSRPKIETLEEMLNNQLTDIVNQILQDEEIRAAISKN